MDKKSNVISLSNILEDGTKQSPREMLYEAIDRANDELKHVKKAVVIFWDETAIPTEQIKWNQAGMTYREMMTLFTMAHDDLLIDFMMSQL